jgi:predicted phosphodiesterase
VVASKFPHVTLHGPYAELEIGGRKVALIHYPEPARRIAQSGQFDLVCYGHNHLQNWERIGDCQLINPGEVMGRYGAPSWGLYDCESGVYKLQSIT